MNRLRVGRLIGVIAQFCVFWYVRCNGPRSSEIPIRNTRKPENGGWTVDVCLRKLSSVLEKKNMNQPSDTSGSRAALAPHALSPEATSDCTLENLSIFSAPALDIVSRWWLESNRRWTERNVPKAPIFPAVARRDATLGPTVDPADL